MKSRRKMPPNHTVSWECGQLIRYMVDGTALVGRIVGIDYEPLGTSVMVRFLDVTSKRCATSEVIRID